LAREARAGEAGEAARGRDRVPPGAHDRRGAEQNDVAAPPARLPRRREREPWDPDQLTSEEVGWDRYRERYSDPTRSRWRGADSRRDREMETLAQMKCVACREDAPTVTDAEIAEFRRQVSDWDIVELDGIKRLRRVFSVDDFAQALEFTKKVGELAEAEGHHPALLTEWARTTVTWWTHKIKGLHRNDFIMAAKTDELYQP
jgi:4a-hydroxytetrahydrobiopterin dehydratase